MLSVALYNLWAYRNFVTGCPEFKILLAIHDAILIEIPAQYAEQGVNILNACMSNVVVPQVNFTVGVDTDVYLRWGEEPTIEALLAQGVPGEYVERKFKKEKK